MNVELLKTVPAIKAAGILNKYMLSSMAEDIIAGDDGFYVFWPTKGIGAFQAWHLRLVADVLDFVNEAHQKIIDAYFAGA